MVSVKSAFYENFTRAKLTILMALPIVFYPRITTLFDTISVLEDCCTSSKLSTLCHVVLSNSNSWTTCFVVISA